MSSHSTREAGSCPSWGWGSRRPTGFALLVNFPLLAAFPARGTCYSDQRGCSVIRARCGFATKNPEEKTPSFNTGLRRNEPGKNRPYRGAHAGEPFVRQHVGKAVPEIGNIRWIRRDRAKPWL